MKETDEAREKAKRMLSRISEAAASVSSEPSKVEEAMKALNAERRLTQEKLERTATT